MEKKEKKEKSEKAKRVSPLDVFIVILLVMCVAGVAVRSIVGKNGIFPGTGNDSKEYAVSFEVSQARASLSGFFPSGEIFYGEDGSVFGTVNGQISVTPARIFTEDEDGKYVLSYSGAENGDNSLVDIKGVMIVKGYKTDYGFLVNGESFISPNYSIALHSDKTTADIRVMDIAELKN